MQKLDPKEYKSIYKRKSDGKIFAVKTIVPGTFRITSLSDTEGGPISRAKIKREFEKIGPYKVN